MSATLDETQESVSRQELEALKEGLEEVRVQARAMQIALMGDKQWWQSGYWWALRDAEEEVRARKRAENERFISSADLSERAILNATKAATAQARTGAVQARDVAVVLMPEATAADMPGRQMLIARVGMGMRELVAKGKLVRVSVPEGRKTSRYALAGGVSDAS